PPLATIQSLPDVAPMCALNRPLVSLLQSVNAHLRYVVASSMSWIMARTKRLPANAGKDKTEHVSGLRVYDGNAMNDTQNTPESVRLRDNLPTPTQMAPVTGLPVTPYSQEASIGASFPAV